MYFYMPKKPYTPVFCRPTKRVPRRRTCDGTRPQATGILRAMIQVRGLTKVFPSDTTAVDGLDLNVATGEILGLLGPNGAGKSTTIRVLSTLSGFDEGEVKEAGYSVDHDPAKVRESIGVVAQNTVIDYFLTGREILELQGQLYRMKNADIAARIAELAQYFDLTDALDRTVATYSGGMRRKLDIAAARGRRPGRGGRGGPARGRGGGRRK